VQVAANPLASKHDAMFVELFAYFLTDQFLPGSCVSNTLLSVLETIFHLFLQGVSTKSRFTTFKHRQNKPKM